MIDYNDINAVNEQLKISQDAEFENRKKVQDAHDFLDEPNGQWEPEIYEANDGRPRYTFDKCTPIVDGIAGEIEGANFGIRVMPCGGKATKLIAKNYDGLIRNIQTMSNAGHVYNAASRAMVEAGIGGWEVKTDFINGSFDQDFIISPIPSFETRIWFDAGATRQDMTDARFVFDLEGITPDEYTERYPKGSKQSVGTNEKFSATGQKTELITVGRILYKKEITVDLLLMSDGSVYERNADFEKVVDDLEDKGVTILRERKQKTHKVMSRLFDGGEFLNKPQETVFKDLPIFPLYGNYKIAAGKIRYRGAIEKQMDAQRTYNYFRSRETEDVALSPPEITWASRAQMGNAGDRKAAENMSVSAQRLYLYTPDPKMPGPPMKTGGPTVSQGLQQATMNSLNDIQTGSARSPLQNGDLEQSLSGVAINALNKRADTTSIKYFKAREIAQAATAKCLINAMPILYDATSTKRILHEDGSFEMLELNKITVDLDTGEAVQLNDLSQGIYDVTCKVGEMFATQQQETVKSLNELSLAVPGLGDLTADIMLQNISAPGIDIAAERVRAKMLQNGSIPEAQYTDEEKEALQKAMAAEQGKPKELTSDQKIAEAEIARVQAETVKVQNDGVLKQEDQRITEQKNLMDAQDKADGRDMEELKLMMAQQAQQATQQQQFIEANAKGQAQVFEALNTQARTLKILSESMGASSEIVSQQVDQIDDQQDEIEEL